MHGYLKPAMDDDYDQLCDWTTMTMEAGVRKVVQHHEYLYLYIFP